MVLLSTTTLFNFTPLQQYDPSNYSTSFCKFRAYIGHTSIMISRTLIVLACFDRACISSSKVSMRNLGKAKVAWKIIFVCIVLWMSTAFHVPTWNMIINGKCTRTTVYAAFFGVYVLIVVGTAPLLFMIIFSAMTLHNIKVAHNRVQPLSRPTGIRQRDFQLTRMLVAEVLVYVISTLPFPIQSFYASVTVSVNKGPDRLAIEAFIRYVTTTLIVYINPSSTFYVYYATSKTFRIEFKETMKNIYYRIIRRPQPRQISLETTRTMVNEIW